MEDGREFKITLPRELADAVERKVASGEYPSVEAVFREGLEVVFDETPASGPAFERWVREQVIPGHEEYMADPSTGVDSSEILARIKARRAARRGKVDCA